MSETVSAGLPITYRLSYKPKGAKTWARASVSLSSLSAMSGTRTSGTGSWGIVKSAASASFWGDASAVVEDPDSGDPESAVTPAKLQLWAKVKSVIMRVGLSMAGVWLSEIVANGCGGMSSPMLAVICSAREQVVYESKMVAMCASSAKSASRKEIEKNEKEQMKKKREEEE